MVKYVDNAKPYETETKTTYVVRYDRAKVIQELKAVLREDIFTLQTYVLQ